MKLALAPAAPAAAPSADGAATAIFPVRPTAYVLDAALPDLGSRAVVRQMTPHAVSENDVQRFARAIGLTARRCALPRDGKCSNPPEP